MTDSQTLEVTCFIDNPAQSAALYPLFQKGCRVRIQTGVSIHNVLVNQWQIAPHYITDRIQTILLNGKPVDSIDATLIKNNDTLALSGAMPGLIGATLRRDGILKPMRESISCSGVIDKNGSTAAGLITVKVFNTLLKEVGPALLKYGIFLSAPECMHLISEPPFQNRINEIHLNGKETNSSKKAVAEKKLIQILEQANPSPDFMVLFKCSLCNIGKFPDSGI